jgi:outer membrane biosynthesis protein TonB
MVVVRPPIMLGSLRLGRLEKSRLLMALLISLLVHLTVWGGYQAEKKFHWLGKIPWLTRLIPKPPAQPPVAKIDPLIFLDVTEPAAEPPKSAKYYSDKNSRAANPVDSQDINHPKLDGKQRDVPKTEDASKFVKTQPPPPVAPQKPAETKPAQADPAKTLLPGGTEKASPEQKPTPAPDRPRTIRDALALQPKQTPGRQMQQDGGVKRRALKSSLDAMATPFGAYDRAIVEAVQSRWYDLLDSQKFAMDRTGKVTIKFHLNPDGSVTESNIADNNVGDLLGYVCQEAIAQAAPFGKWPPDMRRMIGANFREITFTFYYY